MARTLALLLLSLSGCLNPWDPSDGSSTGESSGTTFSGSTGDTSTGGSTTAPSTMTGGSASDAHTGTGGSTGASTTTDSTGPGTTGDPPVCGDGELAPDEECDDGNLAPDDGCNAECARDRLVFATSLAFSPDMIGGLSGADSLCKQLAHKADLPRWASFTAWLSDSATDALDRVHQGRGRYLRPDAALVADDFDALLAGPLLAPIAADEYGQPVNNGAWTGTRPDGTAVPAASHCADWTLADFLDKGHFGDISAVDGNWTLLALPDSNPIFCTTQFHLYCFEGK